jgi:hypothetical protein
LLGNPANATALVAMAWYWDDGSQSQWWFVRLRSPPPRYGPAAVGARAAPQDHRPVQIQPKIYVRA